MLSLGRDLQCGACLSFLLTAWLSCFCAVWWSSFQGDPIRRHSISHRGVNCDAYPELPPKGRWGSRVPFLTSSPESLRLSHHLWHNHSLCQGRRQTQGNNYSLSMAGCSAWHLAVDLRGSCSAWHLAVRQAIHLRSRCSSFTGCLVVCLVHSRDPYSLVTGHLVLRLALRLAIRQASAREIPALQELFYSCWFLEIRHLEVMLGNCYNK